MLCISLTSPCNMRSPNVSFGERQPFYFRWDRSSFTFRAISALGSVLGVMLGGVLASMSLPPLWNFVAFGCVASVTALVVGVTPRSQVAA